MRGWQRKDAPGHVALWTRIDEQGDELIAVCAGMGAEAARKAFVAAEASGGLDLVLSVGLAGATGAAGLTVGSKLRLATVKRTADGAEKRRLANTYAAVLVDMEAATVARLAMMRSLPMGCFKAVSDAADAMLPEIDRFVDREGQLNLLKFAGYLAMHPRYWRSVVTLARGSSLASEALAGKLTLFLQHKNLEYTNRTGRFEWMPLGEDAANV